MSCTEIFGFDEKGYAYYAGKTENAWRGAMQIWAYLEEKYLPPFVPDYVKNVPWYYPEITPDEIESHLHYRPTRVKNSERKTGPGSMEDIWNLIYDENVSKDDRIVLMTTFDRILVKKEDIPDIIRAFKSFGAENTSLGEQAEILSRLLESDDCIAIGWNQTSVNCRTWDNYNPGENDDDERLPYNCLHQNEHEWLEFEYED